MHCTAEALSLFSASACIQNYCPQAIIHQDQIRIIFSQWASFIKLLDMNGFIHKIICTSVYRRNWYS